MPVTTAADRTGRAPARQSPIGPMPGGAAARRGRGGRSAPHRRLRRHIAVYMLMHLAGYAVLDHPLQGGDQGAAVGGLLGEGDVGIGRRGADLVNQIAQTDHRRSRGNSSKGQGEHGVLALGERPSLGGCCQQRAPEGDHRRFEQPGGVGRHLQAVSEALGEQAVKRLFMAADQQKYVRIALGQHKGMFDEMAGCGANIQLSLRVRRICWSSGGGHGDAGIGDGAALFSAAGVMVTMSPCIENLPSGQ